MSRQKISTAVVANLRLDILSASKHTSSNRERYRESGKEGRGLASCQDSYFTKHP